MPDVHEWMERAGVGVDLWLRVDSGTYDVRWLAGGRYPWWINDEVFMRKAKFILTAIAFGLLLYAILLNVINHEPR